MKTLSNLPGLLLKSLAVFALIVAAGVTGVGIAALVAFHDVGGASTRSQASRPVAVQDDPEVPPQLVSIDRLDMWQGRKIVMNVDASLAANRFVAAESSDKPQFTYADNQEEPAAGPAPLDPTLNQPAPAQDAPSSGLTDPGSHYIVDARSGRVVGIDGTAGATAEAREVRKAEAAVPARPREVRAALPVDAVIPSDLPPPKPELYPAIRRAMPVDETADVTAVPPQGFNAASELADDNRPVLRAQPVTISQAVKSPRRLFTLP